MVTSTGKFLTGQKLKQSLQWECLFWDPVGAGGGEKLNLYLHINYFLFFFPFNPNVVFMQLFAFIKLSFISGNSKGK